jgi:hypothetical protein
MVVAIINVVGAADVSTLGIIHRDHKRNTIHWLVPTEPLRHVISVRICKTTPVKGRRCMKFCFQRSLVVHLIYTL